MYRDIGERRKVYRLQTKLSLRYKNLEHLPDTYISSMSKNISQNGICFVSHEFIPISTKMVVVINLDYPRLPQIKAISKLMWIQKISSMESYAAGLEFLAMTRGDGRCLNKFLNSRLT